MSIECDLDENEIKHDDLELEIADEDEIIVLF